MKFFTVSEVGFSYNDEIYSSNEDDNGKPMRLFKSQEAAELARLVLSRKKFEDGEELRNFFYSPEDIVRNKKEFQQLADKYRYDIDDEDSRDWEEGGKKLAEFVSKLDDNEFKTFLDSIYLSFYTVEEVELVSSRNELLTSPEEWEREVGRKMKGD